MPSCSHGHLPFSKKRTIDTLIISVPNNYNSGTAFYKYIGNNGKQIQKNLDCTNTRITINIHKNKPTPVLFYRSEIDAQPQGCVYPVSRCTSIIGGFAAYICYCLYNQSYGTHEEKTTFLAHFNWFKLYDCLIAIENDTNSKGIAVSETIWSFNIEAIISSIANGTFSSSCLKP